MGRWSCVDDSSKWFLKTLIEDNLVIAICKLFCRDGADEELQPSRVASSSSRRANRCAKKKKIKKKNKVLIKKKQQKKNAYTFLTDILHWLEENVFSQLHLHNITHRLTAKAAQFCQPLKIDVFRRSCFVALPVLAVRSTRTCTQIHESFNNAWIPLNRSSTKNCILWPWSIHNQNPRLRPVF